MLELIREYLDISDNSCTGLVWKKIPKNGRSEVGKPAYLAAKRAYHPTAPERCYVK